ncbi:MAG: hypothetical protein IT220_06335 [Flavobacteriaceae bacterium]|nr:hypothetical protein [Flavobacteriaceae bacterium]
MKYTVTIIFGKEQVSKIFNSENLTNEELKLNKKVYSFDTLIEKEAFIKGIEESIGWSECYVC